MHSFTHITSTGRTATWMDGHAKTISHSADIACWHTT